MKYYVVTRDGLDGTVESFDNIEDFKKYISEVPEETKIVAFQGEQFTFNKARTKCRLLTTEYALASRKEEDFTGDFV